MADNDKLPPIVNAGTPENLRVPSPLNNFEGVTPYALFECQSGRAGDPYAIQYFGIFLGMYGNKPCLLLNSNGAVSYAMSNDMQNANWQFVRYLDIYESLTIFGSQATDRTPDVTAEEEVLPMPDILKFGPKDRYHIEDIPDGVPYIIEQSISERHNRVCINITPTGLTERCIHYGMPGMPSDRSFTRMTERRINSFKFERYADANEITDNLQSFVTDFGLRHASSPAKEEALMPVSAPEVTAVAAARNVEFNRNDIRTVPIGVPFLVSHASSESRRHERKAVIFSEDGRESIRYYRMDTREVDRRNLSTITPKFWTFLRFLNRDEIPEAIAQHVTPENLTTPRAAMPASSDGMIAGNGLPFHALPQPRNEYVIEEIPDNVPYSVTFQGTDYQAVNITTTGVRRIKILKSYAEERKGKYLGTQRLDSRSGRAWRFRYFLPESVLDPLIRNLSLSVGIPPALTIRYYYTKPHGLPNMMGIAHSLELIPEGIPFWCNWGRGLGELAQAVIQGGIIHNQDAFHMDRQSSSHTTMSARTRENWSFTSYVETGERIADALRQYIDRRYLSVR